ncbi:MAG: glycosyltransferase family 2 protein, partial [Desulfobacterales bacterium]|nr:glycosyltransferase family 2 protein [Desulfobacterales bacterium]
MEFTVSVIIPSYNYAHGLPHTVKSVLKQSSVSEIIIVDDGSSDNTAEVVADLQKNDRRIQFVYQSNAGPAAARNRGLERATADYVMLLDADDELLAGAIYNLLEPLRFDPQIELVVGRSVAVNLDTGQRKSKSFKSFSTDKEKNFVAYLEKKITLAHGRFIAKRSLFARIQYPEHIRGAEDLSVYAQLFANAKALSIPEEVVLINHHGDSFRHNSRNTGESGLKVVEAVFNPKLVSSSLMQYRKRFYAQR